MSSLFKITSKARDETTGTVSILVESIHPDSGAPAPETHFAMQILAQFLVLVMHPSMKCAWGEKPKNEPPKPEDAPALNDEIDASGHLDESWLIPNTSSYVKSVDYNKADKILTITPTHPAWTTQCVVGSSLDTAAYVLGVDGGPPRNAAPPLTPVDRSVPPVPMDDLTAGFKMARPRKFREAQRRVRDDDNNAGGGDSSKVNVTAGFQASTAGFGAVAGFDSGSGGGGAVTGFGGFDAAKSFDQGNKTEAASGFGFNKESGFVVSTSTGGSSEAASANVCFATSAPPAPNPALTASGGFVASKSAQQQQDTAGFGGGAVTGFGGGAVTGFGGGAVTGFGGGAVTGFGGGAVGGSGFSGFGFSGFGSRSSNDKPSGMDLVPDKEIPIATEDVTKYVAVTPLPTDLVMLPVIFQGFGSSKDVGTIIHVDEEDKRVSVYHEGDISASVRSFEMDKILGQAVLAKPRKRI